MPDPVAEHPRDDALLRCEGVSIDYPRRDGLWSRSSARAVDNVTFSLGRREVLGIVGESGSGKSTLARAIVGLQELTEGSITLLGDPVSGDSRAARFTLGGRVGMIFQDPRSSLNPRHTVSQVLSEPFIVHSELTASERRGRQAALLEAVGLPSDVAARRTRQLSGGQLQRVAIARAIALHPALVVADEPTSALDVSVQAQVLNVLQQIRREREFALLIVSHDIRVVRYFADVIAVMHDGRFVEIGPTQSLCGNPKDAYTEALLNAVPALPQAQN